MSALLNVLQCTKANRGTNTVDEALLQEIERWREMLARGIAVSNPNFGERELNYSVQVTIDRILFLRMCEDRGIESYGQLQRLMQEPNIYANFLRLCHRAGETYNSCLFHFHAPKERSGAPDTLTPSLILDDKPLKSILYRLYYPECPYEFSLLSAEILGQVYERFLGKVIHLTAGHRAVVEDKPEVRKAGGVYYTPTYIVDYIVKQTVARLLEDKTPKQVARLRILDPACGSGSFLLGAYQHLLDWHRDYYLQHGPRKHTSELYQVNGGVWRLTITEKKRILLANIFGVDIDPQAVEVTKLSLLLKVLEGESERSLESQLPSFHERALPNLSRSIQCGNSLIGPDLYEGRQKDLFDEEESYRINAFDWEKAFPWLPQTGGFDAVIGNPPYIDSQWMTAYMPETREYCVSRYRAATGNWDIFCVFIEKALRLAKSSGLVSMIVPNKLGSAHYAAGCRSVLAADSLLLRIRDYSHARVFPVSVYPIVFVALKNDQPKSTSRTVFYERTSQSSVSSIECNETKELEYSRYFGVAEKPWQIFGSIESSRPAEKMRCNFPPLESMATVRGAATVSEAYRIADLISELEPGGKNNPGFKVVNSGTIDRYCLLWGKKPLRYLGKTYNQPFVDADASLSLPTTRRRQAQSQKIIIAGMTLRLECVSDLEGAILAAKSTTLVLADHDLKYFLGILNSRAVAYWYKMDYGGNKLAGGYLRIGPPQVRKIPIPSIKLSKPADKRRHDRLMQLVDQVLSLQDQLAAAKTSQDQTTLKRRIDATDCRIDQLVYELYGLTDREIKIIESASM